MKASAVERAIRDLRYKNKAIGTFMECQIGINQELKDRCLLLEEKLQKRARIIIPDSLDQVPEYLKPKKVSWWLRWTWLGWKPEDPV